MKYSRVCYLFMFLALVVLMLPSGAYAGGDPTAAECADEVVAESSDSFAHVCTSGGQSPCCYSVKSGAAVMYEAAQTSTQCVTVKDPGEKTYPHPLILAGLVIMIHFIVTN